MPSPALPSPSPLFDRFALSPELVFLNHGSFGASPRAVLEAQRKYRDLMESEPVDFFVNRLAVLEDRARAALGAFVGCKPGDLAPVTNATIGVATVFANLKLSAGDEILINDHEYPACCNNARWIAARHGAKVVTAEIPFPVSSPEEVFAAIMNKVTPRTRVALLSHVTSPSALILPIERLVKELHSRGVETLVDGAHAPGFVRQLDLSTLRPTYYTANCHKWICSPKGSAFLYVAPHKQEGFRPVVLSNNAEKPKPGRAQFLTEFDFVGTQDCTAFLAIPDAIDEMGRMLPGGWPAVIEHNHGLCRRARRLLCETLGVAPPAPEGMIGSTATLALPAVDPGLMQRLSARKSSYHDALQDALIGTHRIQVPIWNVAGKMRTIRISAQVYNSMEQFEYLARALKAELELERAL